MSLQLINQYYTQLDKLKLYSGATNEAVISQKFGDLINKYCEKKNLILAPQIPKKLENNKIIRPDGTIKNSLTLDFGYWESKANVDFAKEIDNKIRTGYPLSNTLFEDGKMAILYQHGAEAIRCKIDEPERLDKLLTAFVSLEPQAVKDFTKAVEAFKKDIPVIIMHLREMTDQQEKINPKFTAAQVTFLAVCRESINPQINKADINEMLIQHILTEEIFISIFSDAQFHRENNIAKELYKVEETFFTGRTKHETLNSIRHYYDVIKARASEIVDHHEKQYFLKVIYENFYKAYNPKGADRLGIVYTPNEIVKFMIDSTNYLLGHHFNKTLSDKNVEILDPATGTGTFITELIENYIPAKDLAYKYKNEIHANEIAILPYYIANLNIEYTFQQKMNYYEAFPNICFVDTLDNMDFAGSKGQGNLHFGLGFENAERIKRQNAKKISVIIGNPPYNANQANENDNNKNREYPIIDKRIKETYIKQSTAQKTKVYDMYSRFFRWAMDRIDENGVLSFITNRSFIDSRTYDGFRKVVQDEFDYCYVYDTKSDVRVNPKIAGTTHNVFGIQTGVAIMFLVKKKTAFKKPCEIFYYSLKDEQTKKEKLEIISQSHLDKIPFDNIRPDKNNNWINLADNDFETLLPLASKEVKGNRNKDTDHAIFKLFSLGVVTARDEWVYDYDEKYLEKKVKFLINNYNQDVVKHSGKTKDEIRNLVDYSIKWTRAVKNDLSKGRSYEYDKTLVLDSLYRPFVKKKLYFSRQLNEMQYQLPSMFNRSNSIICINHTSSKDFNIIATILLPDYHINGDAICLSLYRFDTSGNRIDNITDWGLQQFQEYYEEEANSITKEDIFHYTYAILHNPAYRKKYELNLKREFPRIPFYTNFRQWVTWGKELMSLHINYETAEPYQLKRVDLSAKKEAAQSKLITVAHEPEALFTTKAKNRVKLKAIKETGTIEIDDITTLSGIPAIAWQYKLGNRSALEWVLDQYKEKKPTDATIAEKFNTYRFSDYKEQVIDLLKRVCTVSAETMKIVGKMEEVNEEYHIFRIN